VTDPYGNDEVHTFSQVIVGSNRSQTFDPELFLLNGIDVRIFDPDMDVAAADHLPARHVLVKVHQCPVVLLVQVELLVVPGGPGMGCQGHRGHAGRRPGPHQGRAEAGQLGCRMLEIGAGGGVGLVEGGMLAMIALFYHGADLYNHAAASIVLDRIISFVSLLVIGFLVFTLAFGRKAVKETRQQQQREMHSLTQK